MFDGKLEASKRKLYCKKLKFERKKLKKYF